MPQSPGMPRSAGQFPFARVFQASMGTGMFSQFTLHLDKLRNGF